MLTTRVRHDRRGLVSLALLAVAGCTGANPASAPLPAAGALPAAAESRSPATGSSFTYTGIFTQTQSHGTTTTLHLSQHVTTSAATIGGRAVTDYHGVQTESGNGAATTTYDAYVAQEPSSTRSGSDVRLVKEATSGSGIGETIAYDSSNGLLDQLPEVPQAR